MSGEKHVLVVANETLASEALAEAVRLRAQAGPIRVAVVAPVNPPRQGYVVYEHTRRAAADRRLEQALAALRAAGIPAHGGVVDADPVAAVKDVLAQEAYPAQEPHPEAERRLREALAELRADGIEAHGQVAHPDPYAAAMNVVGDERVDEIIVSTFPGERSGWLRRDVVGRLRADAGVPVQHVVSGVGAEVLA